MIRTLIFRGETALRASERANAAYEALRLVKRHLVSVQALGVFRGDDPPFAVCVTVDVPDALARTIDRDLAALLDGAAEIGEGGR